MVCSFAFSFFIYYGAVLIINVPAVVRCQDAMKLFPVNPDGCTDYTISPPENVSSLNF